MSTAYTFDTALSLSFKPRIAESSHRYVRTVAKIFAISAAVVALATALLSVDIESPSTNVHGCTYVAHQHDSRLAIDRDWRTHGPPVLRQPSGTDWIAADSCSGRF